MKKTLQHSLIASMLALTILTTAAPAPQAYAATQAELQAQIAALIAQINALQAQIAAQSGTTQPSITLSRNLSVGMTGSDVLALQQFLNSDPDTQIAVSGVGSKGNETTYFGNLTKQAVIKFQNKYKNEVLVPVGLTQGTGFVGASTRAQITKLGTSVTTPDNTDDNTNGNQGNNDDEEIVAEEGDITVNRGSEHVNTLDLGTTEAIYSVEIKAEDSAMTINRMEFLFDKKVWRYIDSFELYQEGEKIATVKATESNFSTVGNEYRLRFSNLTAVVAKDSKDEFVLKAKALASLSNSRELDTLSVYIPERGIRAMDTAKLTSYGPSNDLDARTFDFRDGENDGTIVVNLADNSPESGLIAVDDSKNSTSDVLVASLKVDESDIELSKVYVKVASSEAVVTNVVRKLSLSFDGEVIASESVVKNGTSAITGTDEDGNTYTIIEANEYYVLFEDLDAIAIDEGDKENITISAEFQKADGSKYASGTIVTFTLRAVEGENVHGEDVVNGNLTVGDDREFSLYTDGLTFSFGSESTGVKGDLGKTGTFKITFDITAFGSDIYVPFGASRQTGTTSVGVGGMEYMIKNSDGAQYTLGTTIESTDIDNAKEVGSFYRISEGTTGTVTLNVTLNNTGATENFYRLKLEEFRYRIGSTTGTEVTIDTGFKNFRTGYESVNN